MKKITILGSTGSIGTQTLEVIAANPDRFCVTALTCGRNTALLAKQIAVFRPRLAVTERREDALALAAQFPQVTFLHGREGLIEAATADCDMVVNALMGMRGLEPTYHAILAGRDIALANKETLVCAGTVVMRRAREKGAEIVPVDSEHSAIFQCLTGRSGELRKILLTGSGGPFRGLSREQTANVTPEQAVKHPNWSMGAKISVDSATMMNKGLEYIEAMHLFSARPEEIEVLIHPESVVHSAVELVDGTVIAQLGVPDMALPIQYALTWPERCESAAERLDLTALSGLHFMKPELEKLPCLALAMDCARRGGTAPAVLSAANEAAVALFLARRLGYNEIYDCVAAALGSIDFIAEPSLEDILAADAEARAFVRERIS